MPSFRITRWVRHSPQQMYDLVADVEHYPEFLPLCESLRVLRRQPGTGEGMEVLVAEMGVGYKAIRERFTTRVGLAPADLKITAEYIEMPDDLVSRVEGKSSLGRLGLIVHATAGFVDPGFKGTLTLEITNLTRVPIKLWAGKPIAQLSFMALDKPAERPYGHPDLGSHYQGQVESTESRYEGGPGDGGKS